MWEKPVTLILKIGYSSKIRGLLIREILSELKIINPIDTNKGTFHLSFTKKYSSFLNFINKDINKNKILIGNAEGKKKIPTKNSL